MSTEPPPERPSLEHLARRPDEPGADEPAAHQFLRLACLTYGEDDGPHRWRRAAAMSAADPSLARDHFHAACAAGDLDSVRRFLDGDPRLAGAEGGPFAWPPLLYVAYGRVDAVHGPDITRVLLAAGADPDAGYLWDGIYPFTALTGAIGGGEAGPERQPPHPQWRDIARLLLEAGADPNDSQALYDRQFEADDSHLELLFAHGLGRGSGGPWRRRVPDVVPAPAELVRRQLHWAVTHGMEARVRLLAERGVDVTSPFGDGATASSLARANGRPDIAAFVEQLGCPVPDLAPVDALVGAVMANDRAAVDAIVAAHPTSVDEARAARPGLAAWVAARCPPEAMRLLVGLGFDVNGLGRSDSPVEQPWQTALHCAAGRGDAALTRVLLDLGADPSIRDARFDGTALDWAQHGGHDDVAALLAPPATA